VNLPALPPAWAELLTVVCLVCVGVLLACRVFLESARALSRPSDYVLLGMVLLPLLSGYLAHHPALSPLRWDLMLLIHMLSAEALFVAVPFTKLAHVVLYPFDRISEVHWQLRPGAGDRVARALFGEEARV
jgi:nitrate reductase gamma subunit